MKAIMMAEKAHRFQTRKSDGSPTIGHPLAVMDMLSEFVRDKYVLAAAVLHDTIEDTDITYEDILLKFGSKVANYVNEVSDDRSLSQVERKKAQLNNISKKSYEARLIKAADMWHNLTDLISNPPPNWPLWRIQGYFAWKKAIYFRGIKGLNAVIDSRLSPLFKRTLPNGQPVIPEGDLDEIVSGYFSRLDPTLDMETDLESMC